MRKMYTDIESSATSVLEMQTRTSKQSYLDLVTLTFDLLSVQILDMRKLVGTIFSKGLNTVTTDQL